MIQQGFVELYTQRFEERNLIEYRMNCKPKPEPNPKQKTY